MQNEARGENNICDVGVLLLTEGNKVADLLAYSISLVIKYFGAHLVLILSPKIRIWWAVNECCV